MQGMWKDELEIFDDNLPSTDQKKYEYTTIRCVSSWWF